MADTNKIMRCKCVSEFQDEMYGKGNRLFNIGIKGAKCTVCGNIVKV